MLNGEADQSVGAFIPVSQVHEHTSWSGTPFPHREPEDLNASSLFQEVCFAYYLMAGRYD